MCLNCLLHHYILGIFVKFLKRLSCGLKCVDNLFVSGLKVMSYHSILWGLGPGAGVTWGQIMANESECLVGRGCHFAEKFVKNIVPSSIFLGSLSKTQNGDQNRIYPPLTLQIANIFPLKGF